jgi:hypothetical protein
MLSVPVGHRIEDFEPFRLLLMMPTYTTPFATRTLVSANATVPNLGGVQSDRVPPGFPLANAWQEQ